MTLFIIHRSTVIVLLAAPVRTICRFLAFVDVEKSSLNEYGGELRHERVPPWPTLKRPAMPSTQVGRVGQRHEVHECLASFEI